MEKYLVKPGASIDLNEYDPLETSQAAGGKKETIDKLK